MPLLPPTLIDALMQLDEGTPSQNILDTADKLAEAWWSYASGMIYLNPATLAASKALALPAFKGAILPGLTPIPAPLPFFVALELAMAAGWLTLSTPASLTPPVIGLTPAPPQTLAPVAVSIVPVGLASFDKRVPRALLAGYIHVWTITIQTVTANPPFTAGPIS